MPSKHFHDLLEQMKTIHDKKSHDYSADSDPFSNFKFAASIVEHFSSPIDQVFAGIIGIKLARLSQLLSGKEALNESTDDSFVDGTNYFALWGAFYRSKREEDISFARELIGSAVKKHVESSFGFPEPIQVVRQD